MIARGRFLRAQFGPRGKVSFARYLASQEDREREGGRDPTHR